MTKMGLLFRLIFWTVIFVVLLIFLPGLPPYVSFPEVPPQEIIPFTGALAPNELLENAEKLFEGKILGPESFATWKGKLYTGTHAGNIISVPDGKLVARLASSAGVKSIPLGLRFNNKGELFVADASLGILSVDINSGAVKTIISSSQEVQGKKFLFVDDLDIAQDGTIYLSLASTKTTIEHLLVELLGEPSGALVKHDIKNNKSEVLMSNIHLANGVQLSPDETYVLLCVSMRHHILKYHLTGPSKGKTEVFTKLPGSCDNIRLESNGNYFVGVVAPIVPNNRNVADILGNTFLRRFMLRFLYLIYLGCDQIDQIIPNSITQNVLKYVLSGQLLVEMAPKYGLVVEVNQNGNIVNSLHSPSGKMAIISQANIHDGYLYLGSPYNKFLGRTKLAP